MSKEKGNMVISSLNATLAKHFAVKALNLFDAIVDPTGAGLYDTIQDALDAGAKKILLKEGTHTLTANITLEDQEIAGESWNTILDLVTFKITFKSGLHRTIGGDIEPLLLGTTLSGNGTGFTAITEPKKFSSSMGNFGIKSIISDSELELEGRYHGILTDGGVQASFDHQTFDTFNVGRGISNMTIRATRSAPTAAIEMSGVNLSIKRCRCLTQDAATRWIDCSSGSGQVCIDASIEDCIFEGGLQAISLANAEYTRINKCRFQGQYQASIYFNDDRVKFTSIQNCHFSASTIGIAQAYGSYVNISESTFQACKTAIKIDTNATWIYNCRFTQCGTEPGQETISAGRSTPIIGLLITSCYFNSGIYAIWAEGFYLDVTDCHLQVQATASIYCKAPYSRILGNTCIGNQTGIEIDASYCIVSNNFTLTTTIGILVDAGADRTLITGNNALGASPPISDLGTNTMAANNMIA